MAMGHNIRGSDADQISRSLENVGDAITVVGQRAVHRGEEVGLCAIRQAEANRARIFRTLSDIRDADSSFDAVARYSSALIEAAEARTEQWIELGEIVTSAFSHWGPREK